MLAGQKDASARRLPNRKAELDALYNDISAKSMFPFWATSTDVAHDEIKQLMGTQKAVPHRWSYKDDMQFLAALPERNSQRAYDLWSARLSLDDIVALGDTRMRVSAWVKNLADKAYWNQGVASFTGLGFDKNIYGEPRTYGLDFSFDF